MKMILCTFHNRSISYMDLTINGDTGNIRCQESKLSMNQDHMTRLESVDIHSVAAKCTTQIFFDMMTNFICCWDGHVFDILIPQIQQRPQSPQISGRIEMFPNPEIVCLIRLDSFTDIIKDLFNEEGYCSFIDFDGVGG